ncbi:MAG TPA: BlaI/MecI/CopY family transcriptional regulator [Vicinamibacterales bacterium]|nr:BlaI/MecI/CopY family transcriptional regulator [Vicinamibacterales bacterium]
MSDARLGPLEARVLDALWTRGRPCSVRDLQHAFPGVAYTTLMTTLDRLHRKGVLVREKLGRAFVYAPRESRERFLAARAGGGLAPLLADREGAGALLSFFVDAVERQDEALLDELERLIQQKRKKDEQP